MHSNSYKHPHRGVVGTMVEWVVNSRRFAAVRRSLLSRLPFLQLQSDVFDVVYLTWLVPVASTRIYSPDSIELWQRNGLTPFTILTYRHKHFGPAMLGPFRQLFPSPHQSNWRFYLRNAPPGAPDDRTVLFTHNVLSSLPYVLGARTMSDVLPAYLPARFIHRKSEESYTTEIEPGAGSAPSFSAQVCITDLPRLPPAFAEIFDDWHAAIGFLALQDAAVVEVADLGRLALAQINLSIQLTEVKAAEVKYVSCAAVEQLRPLGSPLCFVVPQVPFKVCSERLL
jgi:hypothetical protein